MPEICLDKEVAHGYSIMCNVEALSLTCWTVYMEGLRDLLVQQMLELCVQQVCYRIS